MLRQFFQGSLKSTKPGILITFGDGYRSQYEVAAPILEKFALAGLFFVISGACGESKTLIETDAGPLNTAYCMDWRQLADLQGRGRTIGCHTHTHRNLGLLPADRYDQKLLQSKKRLEQKLQGPVHSFCFPFGTATSFNRDSLAFLLMEYTYVFHSFPKTIYPTDSPQSIGRVPWPKRKGRGIAGMKVEGLPGPEVDLIRLLVV